MKNGPYELLWFNCCTGESTTEEIVVENSRFAIPNKPDASDWVVAVQYPYFTNEGDIRYATNISDGTRIGYKYFVFDAPVTLGVRIRGDAQGILQIRTDCELLGSLPISPCKDWSNFCTAISVSGKQALHLDYEGNGKLDLLEISFQ